MKCDLAVNHLLVPMIIRFLFLSQWPTTSYLGSSYRINYPRIPIRILCYLPITQPIIFMKYLSRFQLPTPGRWSA